MIKYLFLLMLFLLGGFSLFVNMNTDKSDTFVAAQSAYWLLLERKANTEYLYFGDNGKKETSIKVKTFKVKTGVLGEKPTPLPELLNRDYWLIINKEESSDNPETAPYFLTLDVPVGEVAPFGPVPYIECEGQCDWEIPGYFGLHGVGGELSKLTAEDEGSSGCVRHSDEDITLLYNLLDPKRENIRYYIEDV